MERHLWAIAVVAVSCSGNSGGGGGKTDLCENEICSGHGECVVNTDGRAACVCEPGYAAVAMTCVADCLAVDCGGLGGCIVVEGEPRCVCDTGYVGQGIDCVPAPDTCDGVECSRRGACIEEGGEPVCICEYGYAPQGLDCVPSSCTGVRCTDHGACELNEGAPSCHCDPGYMAVGLGCISDECRADACSGRGACALVDSKMECTCDHGYVAVDDECRPAPCAEEDCSNHGACVEGSDGLECICDPGYVAVGLSCRPRCSGVACSGHGVCVQDRTGVRCQCDRGYVAEGERCEAEGSPAADGGGDSGVEGGLGDSGSLLDSGGGDGGSVDGSVDSGPVVDGGVMTAHGATWVLIDVSDTPFTMGSPAGELGRETDEVEHEVTLTRDYWIMTTEITQQQFDDVMSYNPSWFSVDGTGADCGLNCPVEQVNWHEFAAYANGLSVLEGLGECYSCTGTAPATIDCTPNGSYSSPYDCPGYRLPTEAEWEYAARGGTTTATYNGDLATEDCNLSSVLSPIGWYCGNASSRTHPVGEKLANAHGLHDMLGNVWEWCHDRYGAYPGGAETDPTGPPSGSGRVYRGGSWYDDARYARAAFRAGDSPGVRDRYSGARFVRSCP